jgi:hypothetical protein
MGGLNYLHLFINVIWIQLSFYKLENLFGYITVSHEFVGKIKLSSEFLANIFVWIS